MPNTTVFLLDIIDSNSPHGPVRELHQDNGISNQIKSFYIHYPGILNTVWFFSSTSQTLKCLDPGNLGAVFSVENANASVIEETRAENATLKG
jgi:hypothetical protein